MQAEQVLQSLITDRRDRRTSLATNDGTDHDIDIDIGIEIDIDANLNTIRILLDIFPISTGAPF